MYTINGKNKKQSHHCDKMSVINCKNVMLYGTGTAFLTFGLWSPMMMQCILELEGKQNIREHCSTLQTTTPLSLEQSPHT